MTQKSRPAKRRKYVECQERCNTAHNYQTPEIFHWSAGLDHVVFIRSYYLCSHMKTTTRANDQASIETLSPAIETDPAVAERANAWIECMVAVGRSGMSGVAAGAAPCC